VSDALTPETNARVKALMKLPKARLADRLDEVMEALHETADLCADVNVIAHEAEGALDARRGGTRERIDRIQRLSLGGWGLAIGTLEVGCAPGYRGRKYDEPYADIAGAGQRGCG
jgi:hypothetical protein